MAISAAVIIQARMGSSRFPGKSLATIGGHPILWHLAQQLRGCTRVEAVVLATTICAADDALAAYGTTLGWRIFRGSELDVLDRYYHAALSIGAAPDTAIVRLTGDDILTDPVLVDAGLATYESLKGRVAGVITDRDGHLPYGAQIELCSFSALARAHAEATDSADREHVTPYIWRNPSLFPRVTIAPSLSFNIVSLSIDYLADLERNRLLIEEMGRHGQPPFHLHQILNAVEALRAQGISLEDK